MRQGFLRAGTLRVFLFFTCAHSAHDLTASGIVEAADLKGFKQSFSFLEQRYYFVRGFIGFKLFIFCVFPREMVILREKTPIYSLYP